MHNGPNSVCGPPSDEVKAIILQLEKVPLGIFHLNYREGYPDATGLSEHARLDVGRSR